MARPAAITNFVDMLLRPATSAAAAKEAAAAAATRCAFSVALC